MHPIFLPDELEDNLDAHAEDHYDRNVIIFLLFITLAQEHNRKIGDLHGLCRGE